MSAVIAYRIHDRQQDKSRARDRSSEDRNQGDEAKRCSSVFIFILSIHIGSILRRISRLVSTAAMVNIVDVFHGRIDKGPPIHRCLRLVM